MPTGLRIAKLYGTAVRHAKWRPLTGGETAAAELRALAAGRADLHAETAGILTGASEGTLMAPLKHCAAGLLSQAGADLRLVPGWIAEGRTRRWPLPPAS